MLDPNRFETTLAAIAKALRRQGIPYMVMGGLAVLVHGRPRMTRDIDITIDLPDKELGRLLDALPDGFEVLVEDPADFVFETRVLPVNGADGTRVNLIFATLPFELEAIGRAAEGMVGDACVRICTPEDLILFKVLSERPKDREDVAGIVHTQGADLDRIGLDKTIAELARELEKPEILAFWRSLFPSSGVRVRPAAPASECSG